jgi:hypothetical protein
MGTGSKSRRAAAEEQATRDRFKASWERQQGRLTTATTASQKAKLDAKLADEATAIKLAKSMATINEELPEGFGKEFGKPFQMRLIGEWTSANKDQLYKNINEQHKDQMSFIRDVAHEGMFVTRAKPPVARDPSKQELINEAWYARQDGIRAARRELDQRAKDKAAAEKEIAVGVTEDVHAQYLPRITKSLTGLIGDEAGTEAFDARLKEEMADLDTKEEAENFLDELKEIRGLSSILAIHQRSAPDGANINAQEIVDVTQALDLKTLRTIVGDLSIAPEAKTAAEKNAEITFKLGKELKDIEDRVGKNSPEWKKAQAAMDMHFALTYSGHTLDYSLNSKGEPEYSLRKTGAKKDPVKVILQETLGGKMGAVVIVNPLLRIDKTPRGKQILADAERVQADVQRTLSKAGGTSFTILDYTDATDQPETSPAPAPEVDKSKPPTLEESTTNLSRLATVEERGRASKIMAALKLKHQISDEDRAWFYEEKRLGGLLDVE